MIISVTFSGSAKLYIQGYVYLFWQTNRIPQSKEYLPQDRTLFTEASGGQLNVFVRSIRDLHKHWLTRFISVLMRYLRVLPVGSYKIGLCLYKTIWFDDHCFEIQDSKWNTLMKLKHLFDFFLLAQYDLTPPPPICNLKLFSFSFIKFSQTDFIFNNIQVETIWLCHYNKIFFVVN